MKRWLWFCLQKRKRNLCNALAWRTTSTNASSSKTSQMRHVLSSYDSRKMTFPGCWVLCSSNLSAVMRSVAFIGSHWKVCVACCTGLPIQTGSLTCNLCLVVLNPICQQLSRTHWKMCTLPIMISWETFSSHGYNTLSLHVVFWIKVLLSPTFGDS